MLALQLLTQDHIFSDGLETGDASSWSISFQSHIFSEDFESGDLGGWTTCFGCGDPDDPDGDGVPSCERVIKKWKLLPKTCEWDSYGWHQIKRWKCWANDDRNTTVESWGLGIIPAQPAHSCSENCCGFAARSQHVGNPASEGPCCIVAEGEWLTDQQPTGFAPGIRHLFTQSQCEANNGEWRGAGVRFDDVTCEKPIPPEPVIWSVQCPFGFCFLYVGATVSLYQSGIYPPYRYGLESLDPLVCVSTAPVTIPITSHTFNAVGVYYPCIEGFDSKGNPVTAIDGPVNILEEP
jgi:hypothetical protein